MSTRRKVGYPPLGAALDLRVRSGWAGQSSSSRKYVTTNARTIRMRSENAMKIEEKLKRFEGREDEFRYLQIWS
ncbi:hypothetical protein RRG08_050831 [Elysia crispata]|uniref:Uncharacterized protein n=1 Tax=Elysia crispata TaxID=231223 RepID=A0AAE1ADV4_9GAST|nr:hypothetical protein RRG08_050831 [Elysia crispata]